MWNLRGKQRKKNLLKGTAFGLVSLTIPMAAYAQVDEIVVQARKTEENLQDVPVSVTAYTCLLYTSPSPRDRTRSRMPSSA